MARICLISPGHLTSNPRLVKEADALTEAGHEVTVISGWSFPPHQAEDRRFESRPWAQHHRVAFGALASPLLRWWHRLRQRLTRGLVRLGAHGPAVAIRAWHPAGPDLIRAARGVRADLYIAHYPAALPAAALAARAHGGLYAFDAEDFHLGDFPEEPTYDFQRQLLRMIEGRYLPGCVFTTASSTGIAEAYADAFGILLPVVLRNVFPLAHAPEGPTSRGTAIPGPSLYWFSQTIGPDRGLGCAIRAIALAESKPHLYLRGFISDAYRQRLVALARAEGVEDRLHLLPPAPPEQMERLAATYDLGLVAENGATPNRRIALTNKLFTYALAGIPMLLSDIPAHRQILAEAGEAAVLFSVEDSASLAEALDFYLDAAPGALARAREAAFQLGQEHWNWEKEQRSLIALVNSVS
jgi:glycosyltransferase involved in cell wall biosynthesis